MAELERRENGVEEVKVVEKSGKGEGKKGKKKKVVNDDVGCYKCVVLDVYDEPMGGGGGGGDGSDVLEKLSKYVRLEEEGKETGAEVSCC